MIENVLTPSEAVAFVKQTLALGQDEIRGFLKPKLKPNRFGGDLYYPVKKYMCYGLYWDPRTYFYEETLPGTKTKPFAIPDLLQTLANTWVEKLFPHHGQNCRFDSCLVNYYSKDETGKDSKLSLHVDKEEKDKVFPVIGLSLGSTAKFVFEDGRGVMQELLIPDRSLYLFGDSMRLMRHGVKNVLSGTLPPIYAADLLMKERLNFTLRKVNL
ncbi:MAG: alpha-ketoglutarate-dependent dioxygenase AlkB [Bacteriovoracaceae bacterium]